MGEDLTVPRARVSRPKPQNGGIFPFQYKTCKCSNSCDEISEEERRCIHSRFENLGNWDARSAFLCATVHKASFSHKMKLLAAICYTLRNWIKRFLIDDCIMPFSVSRQIFDYWILNRNIDYVTWVITDWIIFLFARASTLLLLA